MTINIQADLTAVQTDVTALLARKSLDYFTQFQTLFTDLQTLCTDLAALQVSTAASLAASLSSVSTTSATVQTGTQTITVGTGLALAVGNPIAVAHDASNLMYGTVASYNSGTGALQFTVPTGGTLGSGTYSGASAWTISPTSPFNVVGTSPSNLADGGAVQTSGFTAVSNARYVADTSSGAFTITLPAAPSVKDKVEIAYGGSSSLTFNPNSLKINGSTNTLTITDEQTLVLTYHSTARGWV